MTSQHAPVRPASPWDLVAAHEQARAGDRERRRREGAYYTPRAVAERLAARALGPLVAGRSPAALSRLRILDPAVGGGAFLLAAIEVLAAAGLDREAAARCCAGYDRDPEAVAVAARAVRLAAGHEPDLRVADSLLLVPTGDWDAILGNPPWEKIARHDPRKPAFDAAFADVREGEINLHALFLVWSLRGLRPGGRLGMLTPNTWLVNRWDARLRAFVLAHRLEEVAILPGGTFRDTPLTLPAAIVAERSEPAGIVQVSAPGFSGQACPAIWLGRPHHAMSVHDDAVLAHVEARMAGRWIPLGDVARASDGIYTTTARAFAFRAVAAGRKSARDLPWRPAGPADRPILLSGSELGSDLVMHAGAHIPEILWRKHSGVHECDRLALHAARHPGLARRLVGAVVPAGLYTSNRFINVVPGRGDPWFLAAVLLSATLDAVFARRFPVADVDAFMLHQLPVPRSAAAVQARLAAAARERAGLKAAMVLLALAGRDATTLARACHALDARIEAEIRDLLGLGERDVAALALRGGIRPRSGGRV